MTTTQQDTQVYPSLELCVQFSDSGNHIRKWSRLPFDGGTNYYSHPSAAPTPESPMRELQRLGQEADEADRIDAILVRQGWHGEPSIGQAAVRVLMSLHAGEEVARLKEALEEISDYNIRSWQGQHAYRTLYGQDAYERNIWSAVGSPIDPPDTVARLQEAMVPLLKRYVDLANSGDAGFWDPELEPEVIAARAALEPQAKEPKA